MTESRAVHRTFTHWTPERLAVLRHLYAAGLPLAEIAVQTGATEQAIQQQVYLRGMRRRKSSWTPEREQRLTELWAAGYSASVCARQLGGVTRCAVIAKVHRMGLPARATDKRKASVRSRKAQKRVARRVGRAPVPPMACRSLPQTRETDIARKQLLDLEKHDCRWPVGEPGEPGFGFCAAERVPGSPYCAEHLQRATVPLPPRKEAAEPAASRELEVVA